MSIQFVETDGGRRAAGFKGSTGDCATRAIAIATGKSYLDVYNEINELGKRERVGCRKRGTSNARTGVFRTAMHAFFKRQDWLWTPTMQIGSGCRVHLRTEELPRVGPLVLSLSRHYAAVIDGVLYDTHDSSRGGTRCVYGFWQPKSKLS